MHVVDKEFGTLHQKQVENGKVLALAELLVASDQVVQLELQQPLELPQTLRVLLQVLHHTWVEQHVFGVEGRLGSSQNARQLIGQELALLVVACLLVNQIHLIQGSTENIDCDQEGQSGELG